MADLISAGTLLQITEDEPFSSPLVAGDLVEVVHSDDELFGGTVFVTRVEGEPNGVPLGIGWAVNLDVARVVPADEQG